MTERQIKLAMIGKTSAGGGLNIGEIKKVLSDYNLPTDGTRADLVLRLVDVLEIMDKKGEVAPKYQSNSNGPNGNGPNVIPPAYDPDVPEFIVVPSIDKAASFRTKKYPLPDIPFRMAIVGKSEKSGKTVLIENLLTRPANEKDIKGNGYRWDFEGENIYLVSPSYGIDKTLNNIVEAKQIPDGNIRVSYDENDIVRLYLKVERDFNLAISEGKRPANVLFYMDDLAFSGVFKKKLYGIINRIACNGRHVNISLIVTAQNYTALSTTLRENLTCAIFFYCSGRQLDRIIDDHCAIDKSDFRAIFRNYTFLPHSFIVLNYSAPPDKFLMNERFRPIPYSYIPMNLPAGIIKYTRPQVYEIETETDDKSPPKYEDLDDIVLDELIKVPENPISTDV